MSFNSATGLVNRKVLEGYVASIIQDEMNFVARKALPIIETNSQRAGVIAVEDIMDDGPEDLIRAAGEPFYPAGRAVKVNTVSFLCEDLGARQPVDERDRKDALGNTGGVLKLEMSAYKKAALRLLRNEESQLATLLGTSGNWATNLVGNVDFAYFDGTGGDPLKAIAQASRLAKGIKANTVIFGSSAVQIAALSNEKLVEGLSTMGFRGYVSEAEFDQYIALKFGMKKSYTMKAIGHTTRNPDNAATTELGGNWIWVGYLADDVNASGGRGQMTADASGAVRVVADHEELKYSAIGEIHNFSISNAVDFVSLSSGLGTILTSVLDPG
jgi:hypothetical protein